MNQLAQTNGFDSNAFSQHLLAMFWIVALPMAFGLGIVSRVVGLASTLTRYNQVSSQPNSNDKSTEKPSVFAKNLSNIITAMSFVALMGIASAAIYDNFHLNTENVKYTKALMSASNTLAAIENDGKMARADLRSPNAILIGGGSTPLNIYFADAFAQNNGTATQADGRSFDLNLTKTLNHGNESQSQSRISLGFNQDIFQLNTRISSNIGIMTRLALQENATDAKLSTLAHFVEQEHTSVSQKLESIGNQISIIQKQLPKNIYNITLTPGDYASWRGITIRYNFGTVIRVFYDRREYLPSSTGEYLIYTESRDNIYKIHPDFDLAQGSVVVRIESGE